MADLTPPPWATEDIPKGNGGTSNSVDNKSNHESNRFGKVVKGEIEPLIYLIKGYLYEESLTEIFGGSGSGKTSIILDMCLHMTNGWQWRGYRTKKSQVFYIPGEGQRGIKLRALAWAEANGGSLDDFYIMRTPIRMSEPEDMVRTRNDILELWDGTSPVAIVIDTFSMNLGHGDENNANDTNTALNHCKTFFHVDLKACVVFSHHSGKGDKTVNRGSSALEAGYDMQFRIENRDNERKMINTKRREIASSWPIGFEIVDTDTGLLDCDGDRVSAPVAFEIEVPEVKPKVRRRNDTDLVNEIFESLLFQSDKDYVWAADIREEFNAALDRMPTPVSQEARRKRWSRAVPTAVFESDGTKCVRKPQ